MRKDRAQRRADELQKTAAPNELFVACHLGRNRWVVRHSIEVKPGRFEPQGIVDQ